MNLIKLPPRPDGSAPPVLPEARQITLVGAAGAGKSSFMQYMIAACGHRAYRLSALEAFYGYHNLSCDNGDTTQPVSAAGSVAEQYKRMAAERPYLRDDAPTDLDRLVCLLLTDEFEHLLDLKIRLNQGESLPPDTAPTRLDTLRSLWEHIFPSNRIVRAAGSLMFETSAGSDLIDTRRLSRGERTVLYHIAVVLYAPQGAVVFVEEPTLFVHPAILNNLWTSLERLRPDCRFIYDSVDVDFVNSRTANVIIWVKSYDASAHTWDYEMLPASRLSDDFFIDLIGTRKPVLFIEGDAERSIDARLYALVFSDFTVRPLGSCDRVIEATRTFGSLRPMHHLDSHGIV
ncbi:MAG: AAA family ATPase, partial [Muribaculaceae bacterium]|nr:AAA family ATPase [Muribaculaceae bacterium]